MHIAIEDLLNEFQNTFTLRILTTALMELTSLTASPFLSIKITAEIYGVILS